PRRDESGNPSQPEPPPDPIRRDETRVSPGNPGVKLAIHRGTRPARRDESGNPSHPEADCQGTRRAPALPGPRTRASTYVEARAAGARCLARSIRLRLESSRMQNDNARPAAATARPATPLFVSERSRPIRPPTTQES